MESITRTWVTDSILFACVPFILNVHLYGGTAEDAAVVETLFSIDSMTPTANDSESVCAYQFDIENRSYLLDDSLDYVDVVVRESEGDYTYYCKHLSDAEIESLREIIEVYAK